MKTFRAIFALIFAALAAAPRWILEGGRWILRAALTPPPVPAEASPVEAAVDHELAQARDEASKLLRKPDTGLPFTPEQAVAAGLQPNGVKPGFDAFLYGISHRAADLSSMAPKHQAWLRSLSDEQVALLARRLPDDLTAHLMGENLLRGLPPVRDIDPAEDAKNRARELISRRRAARAGLPEPAQPIRSAFAM